MESSRTISAIVKLWVLLLAAGALYYLWKDRAAPPLASQVEQDEEIAHTDVAVRIGAVKQMTLRGYVVGYGSVEGEPATADLPAAEARVTVDWPAVISEVRCIEGQHVEKGQILFVAKSAQRVSAETQPSEDTVISPISGTVVYLDIHPGEVALPTTTAVKIVDLDRLVVAVGIPAWQVGAISPGERVEIDVPADAAKGTGVKFDSEVERVDRAVDAKTKLVSVDVAVPRGHAVRPGQFVRVAIAGEEQRDCLVVPADSIVRDSLDRPFVAMVSDDRKQAILKLVEPGLREGDWVQISAPGLESGQSIVVSGAFGLLFRSDIKVLNP
jgi:multidrug efflux pump subunit AcrA (membrane-fusion protein)